MASTKETSHAKNVANFKLMNTHAAGFGATYNPANPNIVIDALNSKATAADAAVKVVQLVETPHKHAKDVRRAAYDKLNPLVRSAIAMLKSCDGISETTINDANSLVKRITGTNRAPKKKKSTRTENGQITAEPTEQSHSVSQQSFDKRLANFHDFISILQATPEYAPNEEDIQVTGLNAFAEALADTNNTVNETFIPYNAALKTRDTELYYTQTGLIDIAVKVKSYVSGLNGALSDAEKKQVTAIRFSKPADKFLHF